MARAKRDYGPSLEALLLRQVEFNTRVTVWQQTKDGSKNRNKPVAIPLPGDSKKHPRAGMETDTLLAERQARRQAELAQS